MKRHESGGAAQAGGAASTDAEPSAGAADSKPPGADPKPEHAEPSPPEHPTLPDDVDLWLVDGFNVLHAVLLGGESRGGFWQRSARDRLVARLARAAGPRCPSGEIVVVFDGKHPVSGDDAHPARWLEVVFAPSADDWIVRRVRQSEQPARLGVVTHDRQVAGRARHAGAQIVAPGPFLAAFPEPGVDDSDAPDADGAGGADGQG